MLKSDQSTKRREKIEQTCIPGFLINSTIDYTPAHVVDPEQDVSLTLYTKGVREGFDDASAPYITVCTELGFNTCGTEMHMNKTHVSYLNRLFTTNGDNQMEKGKN